MIRIPDTKWVQTNRSNILGNLWSTFNIDLQSNLGAVRVSPRLKINTSTADVAELNAVPTALKYFSNRFYAVVGTRIFRSAPGAGTTAANTVFEVDTATATPTTATNNSDLEIFNGVLFVSVAANLWSLNESSGTWTQRGGEDPLSSNLHVLTYFKKFNRLYIMNGGDDVLSMNTSYTLATSGDYTLDLGAVNSQFQFTCMKASSDTIWIGAGQFLDKPAKGRIYAWDGISSQPTREYIIDANAVAAITIIDDIPYAMDSNGVLLKFTGSTFEEIGRLPSKYLHNVNVYTGQGVVHFNGLIGTENNTVLALVNNINTDTAGQTTINENLPPGVWEWSPEYGFTHKHSLSYNPAANATITDYGQGRVNNVGALIEANTSGAGSTGGNGRILLGASYKTNASSNQQAIFFDDSNDTVQKAGYFVTTWIRTVNLTETWKKLAVFYRQLLASTDRINVKYRLTEAAATEISITWVNTTSFTTTTNVSAMIGYEVEVLQGTGAGRCVHITAVSEAGGTYTVTIDEVVTGVTTGTAKARLQAWKKFLVVDQQDSESILRNLQDSSTRIQFKVTMLFTGAGELHELVLLNKVDEPLD